MARVTLDDLNRMDRPAFAATLGELFEAMTRTVREAGADRQGTLIGSHPDLAGKAAREGALTADSAREQMSAGLDRLSEEEFAAFHRLNEAYRAKFNMPF